MTVKKDILFRAFCLGYGDDMIIFEVSITRVLRFNVVVPGEKSD